MPDSKSTDMHGEKEQRNKDAAKVSKRLFKLAESRGFVVGGLERPRVESRDVEKALKGTCLTIYDLKLPFLPCIQISDTPWFTGMKLNQRFYTLHHKPDIS